MRVNERLTLLEQGLFGKYHLYPCNVKIFGDLGVGDVMGIAYDTQKPTINILVEGQTEIVQQLCTSNSHSGMIMLDQRKATPELVEKLQSIR